MVGHTAVHASQEAERERRKEEEQMTAYNNEEIDHAWEFKILRSATNQFKKAHTLRQVIEEEKIAGWELLEKFDDGRLRFKRPVGARRKDNMLPRGVDPYRTQFGMGEGKLAAGILAAVLGLIGIFMLVMFMLDASGVL
jgi:hypothetical protein